MAVLTASNIISPVDGCPWLLFLLNKGCVASALLIRTSKESYLEREREIEML